MDKTPRIAISAGHGMSSRTPGRVDPGAGIVGSDKSEADVALGFAKRLNADYAVLFAGLPGSHHMLINETPYYKADDIAASRACDTFLEIHTNSTKAAPKRDGKAVGVEVLYERSKALATALSAAIATALGLPNRGAKYRSNLAALNPHSGMASALIELLFGSDADDVAAWRKHHTRAEIAVLNVTLRRWGMREIKSGVPPRKWGAVRRAFYRRNRFKRS